MSSSATAQARAEPTGRVGVVWCGVLRVGAAKQRMWRLTSTTSCAADDETATTIDVYTGCNASLGVSIVGGVDTPLVSQSTCSQRIN